MFLLCSDCGHAKASAKPNIPLKERSKIFFAYGSSVNASKQSDYKTSLAGKNDTGIHRTSSAKNIKKVDCLLEPGTVPKRYRKHSESGIICFLLLEVIDNPYVFYFTNFKFFCCFCVSVHKLTATGA